MNGNKAEAIHDNADFFNSCPLAYFPFLSLVDKVFKRAYFSHTAVLNSLSQPVFYLPTGALEHFSKYYSHMRTGELLVRAARSVRAIGVPSLPVSLARI
jgi:hypothetical protein